jgi:hypothetical protein
MVVWMVVFAGAVIYLAARVAAFDLDRRVPDSKSIAEPLLQVSHDVLSLPELAVVDDHVNAERRLVG